LSELGVLQRSRPKREAEHERESVWLMEEQSNRQSGERGLEDEALSYIVQRYIDV